MSNDKIFIRETWERPTVEYPQGSHLQQVGDQFVTATGRFEILRLKARTPEPYCELLFMHRRIFGSQQPFFYYVSPEALPWWLKPRCTAMVKQGCVALVHVPGKGR